MERWVRHQLLERQCPPGAPVMFQQWRGLLFLHWPVAPDAVQKTLPEGLQADIFEDRAWIGIVPFSMKAVRPAGVVPFPFISNFLELNLRTYVLDRTGKPGIWFYSLDANQPIAVWIARFFFALPYQHAIMSEAIKGNEVKFRSRRRNTSRRLTYQYRVGNPLGEARLGTLEFFLVERYRLFSARKGQLLTGRVYHSPYSLRTVELLTIDPHLFALDGLTEPVTPPEHVIYAPFADVSVYPMQRVED
ncbi:MAG: DUF2071 domain-containing protein [Verrucomicrobia bacterium]|nr:DUF2071 domain-containing protein [Verrucomicrobiota bacterium]